jgi:hypothetical protein
VPSGAGRRRTPGKDQQVSRLRTALGLGLLVPTLLLGGCAGDGSGSSDSSSAASESPASPDAGSAVREEQAAFIAHYFSVVSDTLSTGAASPFLALSSSQCQSCADLAHNLAAAYTGGRHVEGARWKVLAIRYDKEAKLGSIYDVDIAFSRERLIDAKGKLVKVVKPGTHRFGVAVTSERGRWVVRELHPD